MKTATRTSAPTGIPLTTHAKVSSEKLRCLFMIVLMSLATTAIGVALIVMVLRFYMDYRISVWVPHLIVSASFLLALAAIMVFSISLPGGKETPI